MGPYNDDRDRIQPFAGNRHYWQYKGQPVMLLGGSVEDNLFQIPDLEAHLDLLRSVGGNFVRGTMSSRDPGNVWPWARDPETGLYDLDQWQPEYWHRFRRFLELTAARDIIVQIEIFDPHDHHSGRWAHNPLNPRNNVTWTAEASGLPEVVDKHASAWTQPLFDTVPAIKDLALVRRYQEAFVDKMLSYSLAFGHMLYCMDNETCADPAWGAHWAEHVKRRAREKGVNVETTEMWDNMDPSDGEVPGAVLQDPRDHPYLDRAKLANTLAAPEHYSFVDMSNHNMQYGQTHYETALWVRRAVERSGTPRPINCVKIYGGTSGWYPFGDERQGQQRFWRNVFAGLAAVRFHRPPSGQGLGPAAQAHIRSMRLLTDQLDIFTCVPAPELLSGHADNGAFCLADPGRAYAVCVLDGGRVRLDCSASTGRLLLHWLHIAQGRWVTAVPHSVLPGAAVPLDPPGPGFFAAVLWAL